MHIGQIGTGFTWDCVQESLCWYQSEGPLTWKTGLCKCGRVRNTHMQGLWALPRSKQVGLPGLFWSVFGLPGHQVLSFKHLGTKELRGFSHLMMKLLQFSHLYPNDCRLYFHLFSISLHECQSAASLLTSASNYHDCYFKTCTYNPSPW